MRPGVLCLSFLFPRKSSDQLALEAGLRSLAAAVHRLGPIGSRPTTMIGTFRGCRASTGTSPDGPPGDGVAGLSIDLLLAELKSEQQLGEDDLHRVREAVRGELGGPQGMCSAPSTYSEK